MRVKRRKSPIATQADQIVVARGTVLFHPDYHRRLRNCTESADLDGDAIKRSRAEMLTFFTTHHYRRWGLSPRPENRLRRTAIRQ